VTREEIIFAVFCRTGLPVALASAKEKEKERVVFVERALALFSDHKLGSHAREAAPTDR
jgi:hypothetical protein